MREVTNSNNNNNHESPPPCGHAERLISFLYGEIDGAEKTRFEAHLRGCAACADEATGLAGVRSSIREWREAEFEALAVPSFEIPPAPSRSSTPPSRWLDTVRAYLSFPPVWISGAGATAAVLLVAGIFWFAASSPRNNDVAANHGGANRKPASAPETAPTVQDDLKDQKADPGENRDPVAGEKRNSQPARNEPAGVIASTGGKTAEPDLKQTRPPARAKKPVPAANAEKNNKTMAKTPPPRTKIPSLAIDEDEDDSLRLSDLLREISLE